MFRRYFRFFYHGFRHMKDLNFSEKEAIIDSLVWLATRDNNFAPEEKDFLLEQAKSMGLKNIDKEELLKRFDRAQKIEIPKYFSHLQPKMDAQNMILQLLAFSVCDRVYDSRERQGIKKICKDYHATISIRDIEECENQLFIDLKNAQNSIAHQKNKKEISKSKKWDFGKTATVVGIAATVGTALIVTGGMAAPAIGGIVGSSLFGLSGAAATSAGLAFLGGGSLAAGGLGMVGGQAVIAGLLGVSGGGLAAWKTKHLIDDVKELDLEAINHNTTLNACVGISGFLSEGRDSKNDWKSLNTVFDCSQNYALQWESQELYKLRKTLVDVSTKPTVAAFLAQLASVATKKAGGMIAIPTAILALLDVIDNPWSVAKDRSEKSGRHFGDYLADRQISVPVTLIGYSLGARVIVAAAERLYERNALGCIENVVLLGGAVAKNDPRLSKLRQVVSGKIINVYTRQDLVLNYLYRGAELFSHAIGTGSVMNYDINNLDATPIVDGHLDYPAKLEKILQYIRPKYEI